MYRCCIFDLDGTLLREEFLFANDAIMMYSPLLPESCGYVQKYRFWRKLCRFPALEFEFSDTEYSDS